MENEQEVEKDEDKVDGEEGEYGGIVTENSFPMTVEWRNTVYMPVERL